MITILSALVSLLLFRLRSRASLELELIALRHQVTVLRRQRPGQLRLFSTDRLLWVWLYRSTFTGMTRGAATAKPPGAWTPEQVIDMLVAGMAAGDFYILCPDHDVTRDIDNRRIRWTTDDIIRNRPALSRWHPDYKDEFAAFLASGDHFDGL